MKKYLVIVAMSSLLCLPLSARITPIKGGLFGKTTYGKDTKIGFEVLNKSSKSIWVGLRNGTEFLSQASQVSPATDLKLEIDISKPTQLFVWLADPGKTDITATYVTPPYDMAYSFTPGKTIYITWDKDNFPRPQTGPLK